VTVFYQLPFISIYQACTGSLQ